MLSWSKFAVAAPDLASAGKRMMYHREHGEVALLATVNERSLPQIAPICPIFTDTGIYLLAGADTPKRQHLSANGAYALHAQVGASDEEFSIRGHAQLVTTPAAIDSVMQAIVFEFFDPEDPAFELLIDFALWVSWPTPGKPIKRRWRASDTPP